MNTETFVFANDTFVLRHQAHLHVDDLAVQRGYGVFDFFRVLDGQPVFLDDHLDRFERSAQRMRLPLGRTRSQLKEILRELIERNAVPNAGIRLTLTGGCAADGYAIATPNLVITQRPLPASGQFATTGVRLTTFEHQRQLCDVKTIDYLMAIWLQPLVAERGADDVLYHQRGLISECPRSNVYLVTKGDQLVTPGRNILKGVNRKQVLDIARERMVVEERDVHVDEIRDAKEAFITGTTKGVVPVLAVDARPIGHGRSGEATRWLGETLNDRAKTVGAGWGR